MRKLTSASWERDSPDHANALLLLVRLYVPLPMVGSGQGRIARDLR